MANTLLRLGLWILVLVLTLWVLDESYADQPFAELIEPALLKQALVLGVILIVASLVVRVVGKGASAVNKNRCKVCRNPIVPGAMYCRAHLREMLAEEDEKTHMTRLRR